MHGVGEALVPQWNPLRSSRTTAAVRPLPDDRADAAMKSALVRRDDSSLNRAI